MANITDTPGAHVIVGSSSADMINGLDGDDTITGLAGNDSLLGGDGNDSIDGGTGKDSLYGGNGDDTLVAGAGNDLIDGGAGNDSLVGGDGDNVLYFRMGDGHDTISGGAGFDSLTIELTSEQLTAAVRADFALLADWMADQSKPLPSLSHIGLDLSSVEFLNILVDGQSVDIADLIGSLPFAEVSLDVTASEDTAFAGQIATVGPDGQALTVSLLASPAHGTLHFDARTGGYVYQGASNFSGADGFVVRIADASGVTIDQHINVAVNAVADLPVVQAATTTIVVSTAMSGTAADETMAGGVGDDLISGGAANDVITGDDASSTRQIALEISSILTDLDGSETLSIRISGLPADAVLSAGAVNSDGSWSLSPAQLAGLTLTTAATTDFTIDVAAIASEANASSATATTILPVLFTAIGSGSDTLDGGAGDDQVSGNAGDDVIDGGTGSNTLSGGAGDDTLMHRVGSGFDEIAGDAGHDTVVISLESAQLTAVVRTELATLQDWMQGQLAAAGSGEALGAQTEGDMLMLADLGLSLTTVEEIVVMRDGVQVELASLLNSGPEAAAVVAMAATEDTALAGHVVASDADGDALAWSILVGPAHGTLALDDTTGQFIYTGVANYGGLDSFSVRVTDFFGASVDQRVDVTVAAVADAPMLNVAASTGVSKAMLANMVGTRGNDTLTGTAGNDRIDAAAGNDLVYGDGAATVAAPVALGIAAALADLDGSETLSIRISGMPAGATLSAGVANADGSWTLSPADLAGLTLTSTSGGSFTLTVAATATEQSGASATTTAMLPVSFGQASGGGDDTISAGSGNDTVHGGDGNDWIDGNAGGDTIYDGNGNDTVRGSDGNDVLRNGAGDDVLRGGEGNDVIFDGAGNDVLRGGRGNDLIVAASGNDSYVGGSGYDTLDYSSAGSGLTIDIAKHMITGPATVAVESIESVIGGQFADSYKGSWGADVFNGGAGNDLIRGLGGEDMLTGGAGRDTFVWTRADIKHEHGCDRDHDRHDGRSGVDIIADFGLGDSLDLRDFIAGAKAKTTGDAVHLKDNAWGTMVSVKIDNKFVDIARLEGFHDSSVSHMQSQDMILV